VDRIWSFCTRQQVGTSSTQLPDSSPFQEKTDEDEEDETPNLGDDLSCVGSITCLLNEFWTQNSIFLPFELSSAWTKVINTLPDYVPVFYLSGTSRIGTVDTVFLVPGVKNNIKF